VRTRETSDRAPELPLWLWLGFPPLMLAAVVGARLAGEDVYDGWMRGERGAVETGTTLCLLAAVALGAGLALPRGRLPDPWMRPLLALFTLGSLYFAGEEASWGQHWFHWRTPEAWAALNDQRETNLHNTLGVFDQLPRLLLTLGAVLGGVVAPLVARRRRRPLLGERADWLLPTIVCLPAALLAVGAELPQGAFEWAGRPVPGALRYNAGELKEYYLALFLSLYALSLWRRSSPSAAPAPAA